MGLGEPSLHLGVRDGDDQFEFVTQAGVRSAESFHDGELAVLEAVVATAPDRVLVIGESYGVVGIPSTTVADQVVMTTFRDRTRRLCARNCQYNGVRAETVLVDRPTEVPVGFDVVGYAPRAYTPNDVVVQHALDALTRLDEDGVLVIGARDDAGGNAHARRLEEFASITEVDEHGEVTVRRIEKPPAFDPPTLVEPTTFDEQVRDTELTLVARSGLFAADGLDTGTRLLIETLDIAADDRVLDLGCGYGPIGAYAATQGASTVLTDDRRPATACAERTLDANNLDATVTTADATSGVQGQQFDLVASNPPTHAGDAVLDAFFADIATNLALGGRVRVVHHESLDLTPHFDDRLSATQILADGPEHVILGAEYQD